MKSKTLLSLLSDREVHSGESLAQQLGVSRTAVWKQVRKAIREGTDIRTIRGQGYQLVSQLDLLELAAIQAALDPDSRARIDLAVLDEVDSTNAEVARRMTASSSPVVIADRQTSGRGRRGRNWASPKGQNLYLSLGLTIKGGFSALDGLSLALGVAVADALGQSGICDIGLKWPNDLFAGQKKFGGILVEIQGELQEGSVQVIAGIGLNVHMSEAGGVDQPWTSLALRWPGERWVRNQLAGRVIRHVLMAVDEFEAGGFLCFRDRWQQRDIFRGRSLVARGGDMTGYGVGIDECGNYLVDTAEGVMSVRAGDISLRISE
ncbi:biotin--[acetyl-CoA-carboxylase] ligase [Marinobacter daepoensis]|uniref:biotin--[acetyl-CoA-carboxylase] ligase n=1 Tax=Marinobacter daepoensis TaxID=262077 RepID=UPI001C944907|nr:biotin--[acetyl-CoA-carboxylase] ligase [Marinobacter daepoensis]MBY6034585.1 biotin--[acetyl-CoA-carboxylase] ligase [Marinobacter daepoensis]